MGISYQPMQKPRKGFHLVEAPQQPVIPYYEMAKTVFNSEKYTPEEKEGKMFTLYVQEFCSHEHNLDLDWSHMFVLATEYAAEMARSLKAGGSE